MTDSIRKIVNPEALYAPPGFSHIVVSQASRLAFISGQLAWDRDYQLIGEGDLFAQTRQAYVNLDSALKALGVGWDHVIKAVVYTLHPTEYEVMGRAAGEVIGDGVEPPAQTIVGVTGLAVPGALIEVELVVALPPSN